eukprot:SAG31_NODE_6241_length_2106_cov_10.479322_1_plen_185_part_00
MSQSSNYLLLGTVGGKKKTKPHVKLEVESTLLPSSPDGVKDVMATTNSVVLSWLLQLVSHVSMGSRDTKLRRCQKIYPTTDATTIKKAVLARLAREEGDVFDRGMELHHRTVFSFYGEALTDGWKPQEITTEWLAKQSRDWLGARCFKLSVQLPTYSVLQKAIAPVPSMYWMGRRPATLVALLQ